MRELKDHVTSYNCLLLENHKDNDEVVVGGRIVDIINLPAIQETGLTIVHLDDGTDVVSVVLLDAIASKYKTVLESQELVLAEGKVHIWKRPIDLRPQAQVYAWKLYELPNNDS